MTRRTDLGELLAAHRPADAREAGFLERMLRLLAVPGDPFSRDHFDPGHFTASSFVLSPDRGSLLLILHGKLGLWLQPGGHIDPGDPDVLAAARREVSEEVGITELDVLGDGLLDVDIHDIPALKGDPPHQHFDVRFCFAARSLSFVAGSDAKAARWVPLGDVPDAGTDDSVLRAVRKLQGRALDRDQ